MLRNPGGGGGGFVRGAAGEMVGLLGPNGAGKTTTVSIIAGLLVPDRGEVRIEGGVVRGETDPVKLRLGLVPQEVRCTTGFQRAKT